MTNIIKALKRQNDALPGLVLGILLYGLAAELALVWFVPDRLRFTSGLWIGIACAVGMAVHIAAVLDESVRFGGGNVRALAAKSALRYVAVAFVFFAMMYFHVGELLAAFAGVLGLKVSAYVQQWRMSRNQSTSKESKE